MKNHEFEVGVRVKNVIHGYDDNGKRGTVISNKLSNGDEVVAIEWDDGSLTKTNVSDIKKYDSALEAEFLVVAEKVKVASNLLKEANAILHKHGTNLRDARYDEDGSEQIDTYGLFAEIRNAGWSTSSMNC